MVALTNPDLQQVNDHFEQMIDALERYRATLLARRERYQAEGRDPSGYAGPIANNLKRIDRLEAALDGDVFDLLRGLLDGSGVLASVDEGRWI
jgi:hypothetical protein